MHQIGMRHRGVQHRRRIGEAGGLEHHAVELACGRCRDRAAASPARRPGRRAWCSTGSRDCSSTMLSSISRPADGRAPISPNSLMMTAVSASAGSLQQAVEQRGLAGAEEAGEHGQRDRLGGGRRARRCRSGRAHCAADADFRLRRAWRGFRLAWRASAAAASSWPACIGLPRPCCVWAWRRSSACAAAWSSPAALASAATWVGIVGRAR